MELMNVNIDTARQAARLRRLRYWRERREIGDVIEDMIRERMEKLTAADVLRSAGLNPTQIAKVQSLVSVDLNKQFMFLSKPERKLVLDVLRRLGGMGDTPKEKENAGE